MHFNMRFVFLKVLKYYNEPSIHYDDYCDRFILELTVPIIYKMQTVHRSLTLTLVVLFLHPLLALVLSSHREKTHNKRTR